MYTYPDIFSYFSPMTKSDRKSIDKMFESTGGKLALEYLYQNPIVRSVFNVVLYSFYF